MENGLSHRSRAGGTRFRRHEQALCPKPRIPGCAKPPERSESRPDRESAAYSARRDRQSWRLRVIPGLLRDDRPVRGRGRRKAPSLQKKGRLVALGNCNLRRDALPAGRRYWAVSEGVGGGAWSE